MLRQQHQDLHDLRLESDVAVGTGEGPAEGVDVPVADGKRAGHASNGE